MRGVTTENRSCAGEDATIMLIVCCCIDLLSKHRPAGQMAHVHATRNPTTARTVARAWTLLLTLNNSLMG
jgi:hypothetical protein